MLYLFCGTCIFSSTTLSFPRVLQRSQRSVPGLLPHCPLAGLFLQTPRHWQRGLACAGQMPPPQRNGCTSLLDLCPLRYLQVTHLPHKDGFSLVLSTTSRSERRACWFCFVLFRMSLHPFAQFSGHGLAHHQLMTRPGLPKCSSQFPLTLHPSRSSPYARASRAVVNSRLVREAGGRRPGGAPAPDPGRDPGARDRVPRRLPAWGLLLPLPVCLCLSLSVCLE